MLWGMLGLSSRKSRLCKPQKGRLDAGYIWIYMPWQVESLLQDWQWKSTDSVMCEQSSSANVWTASFWKGTILTCSGQELEPYTKYHPFDFEDRICWFKHHMAIHDTSQYLQYITIRCNWPSGQEQILSYLCGVETHWNSGTGLRGRPSAEPGS